MVVAPESSKAKTQIPQTLVDHLAEQIRRRIVLGEIGPGQRVPLYALADEFGVSRVPLREVVRQLEAEGLVVNLPRRGAIVRGLGVQDLRDCFGLLEHIEMIAAERAASSANPAMISAMRLWADRMYALRNEPVSEEMLEAHRNFHFALFDALGEGILLHLLRMLWHTCERYVMHCLPDSRRQSASRDEHATLIELVEKGDGVAAARLLSSHIRASLEFSQAYLERELSADPKTNSAPAGA